MKSHSSRPAGESSTDASCPICLSNETAACRPGRDRLFGLAQGEFPLFRCTSCGCVFQHPFPEDAALAKFYPPGYWWSEKPAGANKGASLLQKMEKAYREFVVANHVRFLESCAREHPAAGRELLDIGCGSGTFLHIARSHGFVPHGMDRSPQAVEIVQKQYGYAMRQGGIGDEVWPDRRFGIITMVHVLEHLK